MMIEAQNYDFLTYILSELSARFQLENQSAPARLGSAQFGTFIARACSSRKIPAQTHPYDKLQVLDFNGKKTSLGVRSLCLQASFIINLRQNSRKSQSTFLDQCLVQGIHQPISKTIEILIQFLFNSKRVLIHLPESRLLGQKFAKYIGLSPRVLEQYKKNNDIIYDVIFIAPKVNLRDHKRPKSKNTFYKGFNLKRGFFSAVLIKMLIQGQNKKQVFQKNPNLINCIFRIG